MNSTGPADRGLFDGGPPVQMERRLGLIKPGNPRAARRAILGGLIAWVPLVVISMLQGTLWTDHGTSPLLLDVAAYARFLVAVPLLILAESISSPRLGSIADHFLLAGLVTEADRGRFDAASASTRRLLDSKIAEAAVFVLAYAMVASLMRSVSVEAFPSWHHAMDSRFGRLTLAGWWHALVSLPLLLILILGWLWRLFLWARFLWLVARLDLQLVPVHPDRMAGLRFVGYSVRAFSVLGFAVGAVVAGRIGNVVLHDGASLLAYKHLVVGVVGFLVVLFTAPLLAFFGPLLRIWRQGVFDYGALAGGVGHRLEEQWLHLPGPPGKGALEVGHFSATTDLYQIVSNVYSMRLVPVDLSSVILLVVATLLPFLPVILMAMPVDVLMSRIAELLL